MMATSRHTRAFNRPSKTGRINAIDGVDAFWKAGFFKSRRVGLMVTISAMYLLFLDHRKCFDLIFIYLSGLTISIRNLRLLKYASVVDKQM